MRTKIEPLLCELHAHTTWSDGELEPADVVDLHGLLGFDVLCITDHVIRSDDPWRDVEGVRARSVDRTSWRAYLAEIEREAARAKSVYGMLVLPGVELTFNHVDPAEAAHAVAIGVTGHIALENGIAEAICRARSCGAAIVAAHPSDGTDPGPTGLRRTERFARDPSLRALAHRFELFNRSQLFGWVADAGLPAAACGDFHRPEHLAGWRTLIPCDRDPASVVSYLRSERPVYLARFEPELERLAA
jgi:hypothetical protein